MALGPRTVSLSPGTTQQEGKKLGWKAPAKQIRTLIEGSWSSFPSLGFLTELVSTTKGTVLDITMIGGLVKVKLPDKTNFLGIPFPSLGRIQI